MGSILSNLTTPNSALLNPAGQPTFMGSPSQVLSKANAALPSAANMPLGPDLLHPNTNASTSQIDNLPKIGQPSFLQAATSGPGGTPNALSPGLSKMGKLAVLLTSGLKGALGGRAVSEQTIAQTGGHRAGGVGMGFEAGLSQPYQEAEQRQQAQLGQAGLQPIELPGGTTVPAAIAPKFLSPYLGYQGKTDAARIGAQGKLGAAQIGADSRENVADTSADAKRDVAGVGAKSKLDVENLKIQVEQGKVARIVPTPDGKYEAFNKFGKSMGVMEHSIVPSMMARTSDTVQYETDADGNIVALPKRTVMQKTPGGASSTSAQPQSGAAPSGARGGGVVNGRPTNVRKNVPNMATGSMADGSQVAGTPGELNAAGAKNLTKLEAGDASKVSVARQLTAPGGLYDLIDKDLAQFKPEELTAITSRWKEFQAGTLGSGDARFGALRTHTHLLGTALMQAHVGSRGGEHMMDEFEGLSNAGKMDDKMLRSTLKASRDYVNEKAMRPKATAAGGGRVLVEGKDF